MTIKKPWINTYSGAFNIKSCRSLEKYLQERCYLPSVQIHNCNTYIVILFKFDMVTDTWYSHQVTIPAQTLYCFKEQNFDDFEAIVTNLRNNLH